MILDQLDGAGVLDTVHIAMVNGQDQVLEGLFVFNKAHLEAKLPALVEMDVALMGSILPVVGKLLHNAGGFRLGVGFAPKHHLLQLSVHKLVRPGDGIFTATEESWRVLGDDRLPNRDGGWFLSYLSASAVELFDNPHRRKAPYVGIDGTEISVARHQDLPTTAGNHRAGRHRDLGDDAADITIEQLMQVVNQRVGGTNGSARGYGE